MARLSQASRIAMSVAGINDRLGLRGEQVADKYLVEGVVGDGGFSLVYRATHKILSEPVAIKCFVALSTASEDAKEALLESFVREGKLMMQLSTHSSSIVQARDIGSLTLASGEWIPYLVLEWLEGKTLAGMLDAEHVMGRPPRTLRQAMDCLQGPAHALGLAHELGVAHLDVKPDNFFVCGETLDPNTPIKVLDFGVSKVFDPSYLRTCTTQAEEIFCLTPDYAAPEMFEPALGPRGSHSDVFSFALVMIEVLRGGLPVMSEGTDFNTDQLASIRKRCLDPTRRPTPRSLGIAVPDAVEKVFERALAVKIQDRYPNMHQFWEALCSASNVSAGQRPAVPQALSDAVAGIQEGARPVPAGVPSYVSMPVARGISLASVAAVILALSALLLGMGIVVFGGAPASSPEPTPEQARCPEGMRWVPGGRFFMGSDSDARALRAARPAHAVELLPFCLDRTEVTLQAYRECSAQGQCKRAFRNSEWDNATPEQVKAYSLLCNENYDDRGTHPVNCVTWKQAQDYCKFRGFRLPREAEWEFAARGSDGRVFPWGDSAPGPQHANVCGIECTRWRTLHGLTDKDPLYSFDDGFAGTAPVGSYPQGAGQWGHLDLVGNLFEWTVDDYLPYPNAGDAGIGFSSAQVPKLVVRGGAFNSFNANFGDPALRFGLPVRTHSHGVGFRCAADVGAATSQE